MFDRLILSSVCPCGSGAVFAECCAPFVSGEKRPDIPEQLMRSRYTAYVLALGDYLHETHHSDFRGDSSPQSWSDAAKQTRWVKLQVIAARGGAEDVRGQVEFKAWFRQGSELCLHHEVSQFEREQGAWRYTEGEVSGGACFHPGRNDSCPCGSGKKFKKCCGG